MKQTDANKTAAEREFLNFSLRLVAIKLDLLVSKLQYLFKNP